jgi:metallo-beta-lactamase family protein
MFNWKGDALGNKVTFHGGTRTVTGSMHMISNNHSSIIIDCGLFQGRREEFFERNSHFPFDPKTIDRCILSHAHIDHSGNIPNLVKQGFAGTIVTTEATKDLCNAMLPDSGHIQEEDAKFMSKIHKKKGLPSVRPLYTRQDAENALGSIVGHPYHEKIKLDGETSVTFYDAGHVLGSAVPLIEFPNKGRTIRLAYAVDLGRKHIPILKDPEIPPEVDYLFLESTYGGRLHSSIDEAKDKLARVVGATIERGGKIIIPSFALERTQEIVYFLSQLFAEGRLPDIPVYVDSPLAVNITEVFRSHPECYDEEMKESMRNGIDPFGTGRIQYITAVEESKRLNFDDRPMIIISASGMCEAGRILHHLRNNIENPNNTIMIVGYMARNTLGRRIVERNKRVKIFGEEYALKAEVAVMNAFSAHADRRNLLDYALRFKERVKKIFIVHGDEDQSEKLQLLLEEHGLPSFVPRENEAFDIS